MTEQQNAAPGEIRVGEVVFKRHSPAWYRYQVKDDFYINVTIEDDGQFYYSFAHKGIALLSGFLETNIYTVEAACQFALDQTKAALREMLRPFGGGCKYKYFAYDEGEIAFFSTAQEAQTAAEASIEMHQEEAANDAGWGSVEDVCWGKVLGKAIQTSFIPRPAESVIDEDGYDPDGTYWGSDWAYIAAYALGDPTAEPIAEAGEPEIKPVDKVLFCPNCRTQHIDFAEPDKCEDCGLPGGAAHLLVSHHFNPWLNPPHKKHRCKNCNYVWKPFPFPTNGVPQQQEAQSEDKNDER